MDHKITYYEDGSKNSEYWYQNGKLHRLDGPAAIYYDNSSNKLSESWYQNGQLHRLDGPAVIDYYTCENYYYINGKGLTKEQFKLYLNTYVKQIKTELNLYFNDVNLIPIVTVNAILPKYALDNPIRANPSLATT